MANDTPRTVTAWSGLDLLPGRPGGAKEAREAIRESAWHPAEGTGHRHELLALVSRVRPAAFLSALEVPADHVFGDPPSEVAWHDDLGVTWSLLYHPVAVTGPELVEPFAVYVLGVNPPPDIGDAELAEFNDFYTNVHLPEVAERRNALRATRYELDRVLRPPAGSGPQFLAVYEVDEPSAQQRKHVGAPYEKGPEVWQRHTTPWRFWYRRLPD